MNKTRGKNITNLTGLALAFFLLSFFVVSAHDDTEEHNAMHLLEAKSSTTTVIEDEVMAPNEGTGEMEGILQAGRNNLQERQEERAEAIENIQEVRTGRAEERQVALNKAKQQRIINLAANISNRMEAIIERLFNLIGRLEERIAIMKQSGINTATAESKLREAAQLLSEARAKLTNIDYLVVAATTSTEPKSDWQNVRQTYSSAADSIKKSHQALREVVSLLKVSTAEPAPVINSEAEAATTTATTTSE